MNQQYVVQDTSSIYTPALLFYKDIIGSNIGTILRMAGNPSRLRPHVKTHKTREIVRMELDAGITKHKCATIAEAEMLASCGAPDVLLAYNIVGPNCARLAQLIKTFPNCRFSVLADHPMGVKCLAEVMQKHGTQVEVLIDLDVGQHRTGVAPGPEASAVYEFIGRTAELKPGGFHVYDGHNHQSDLGERTAAVQKLLAPVLRFRDELQQKGLPVARIVAGGTPTFPIFAKLDLPGLECSPGTCVLHDNGYGTMFTDMSGFTPAALLLTRVISRPTPQRVTLDLGYKAVASDPPAGKRCILLNVPDYTPVLQNEEHFVVETPAAAKFSPGDVVYAIPTHICPTCAMHQHAYVVEDGKVTDKWQIVARDRVLSI